MSSVRLVSASGSVNEVIPSPALKPICAPLPDRMSSYMNSETVLEVSVPNTT